MKHTTEEMIVLIEKIQKKYGLFYQCEKYDTLIETIIGTKKTVKVECHKLYDLSIKNKYESLQHKINNNNLWNRCHIDYICPIVLTYDTENGVGGQYLHFPASLNGNILNEKNLYNINTESSFDSLYEKYKKNSEDYFIKVEYDIKQAKVQMDKDNIERMFNPNYISPFEEDFFSKLENM